MATPWEKLVDDERKRQVAKFGDRPRSLERMYVLLGEEFGELARAIVERSNVDEEVIQVAAVCKLIWETGRNYGYYTEKGVVN